METEDTMETEENLLPFRLAEGASISIIRPAIQYPHPIIQGESWLFFY